MGLPEIVKILVSLAAPVPVLLIVLLLGRRVAWLRRRFARIPRRLRPVACLGCLSLASTAIMASWALLAPPQQAAAAATMGEGAAGNLDAINDMQLGIGGHWIYIYHLENWGEVARRERIGERITAAVREGLKDEGIAVRTGEEHRIPLDLFQQERPDAGIMTHYRKVVPFTCVWGYVSTTKEGTLEVQISVNSADANIRPNELLTRTFAFGASPDAIKRGTNAISEEVVNAIKKR